MGSGDEVHHQPGCCLKWHLACGGDGHGRCADRTILGGSSIPVASGLVLALGAVVGFLGGRRFLVSILVGTVLGGLLAWLIAGLEKVSFGAGAGAAMGGFLGVQISMLLDVRAARRAATAREASRTQARLTRR
jgi:hypothetical protein